MQRLIRLLVTETLEQAQGDLLQREWFHYGTPPSVPMVRLLAGQEDDVFVAFLDLLPRTPANLVVAI